MDNEELQVKLKLIFDLIDEGKLKFSNKVPNTIKAIKKIKKNPDGSFDLSTVDNSMKLLCNVIDAINSKSHESVIESELPKINLPEIHQSRKTEGEFMRDIIDVSNTVIKYLMFIGCLSPTKKLDDNYYSVIMGHMVRLYKLYDSFICLTVYKGYETASIILRSITETAINLNFLLVYGTAENVSSYKKSSLWYEKKLWDEIQSRKNDPPLHIEKRMLKSIEQTFHRAGVDINSISRKDRDWGGDLYSKSQKTELVDLYEFNFRGTSHNVHGTWHDLEFHHINDDNGIFKPIFDYTTSRPQTTDAVAILCLRTSQEYVKKIMDKDSCKLIYENLNVLVKFFTDILYLHERWLQEQK